MAELKLPFIGHGGDYNPDQWRDRPDILEEDIRLMKLARCNLMSVGIFAWAALAGRIPQIIIKTTSIPTMRFFILNSS